METLFKRYFWAIQLSVAILAALLIGAGLSRLVLAKLAPFGVAIPPAGMATGPAAKPNAKLPLDPISEVGFAQTDDGDDDENRCQDVACEDGMNCDPETGNCVPDTEEEQDDESVEHGPCYDTELKINLSGTMVSSDPEWAVAILHDPGTQKTVFAKIGDTLLNQAKVTDIQRNRVMIQRDGYAECIRPESVRQAVKDKPKQKRIAASTNTTSSEKPSAGSIADVGDDAVKKTGTNEYQIDKNALNSVMNNQAELKKQAPTVTPFYRDGKPQGFRLSSVKSDSVFSQLGIKNGDVIHSVNGQVIDSPQRAMSLYKQLGQTGTVKMEVERGGRPVTFTYDIK